MCTTATMEQQLLTDIRAFMDAHKMAPAYFGKLACGNTQLLRRLESGKTVTLRTSVRIRTFISGYEPKNPDRTIPLPKRRATGAAQGTA